MPRSLRRSVAVALTLAVGIAIAVGSLDDTGAGAATHRVTSSRVHHPQHAHPTRHPKSKRKARKARPAPRRKPTPTPTATSRPAPAPTAPTPTAPTALPPAPAPQSAVTWVSGVYAADGIDAAAANRFGGFRGHTVGIATVYTDRRSWSAFADDLWTVQQYQGWPGRLSIGIPLTLDGTTLAQVASGAADQWFTTYAGNLAKLGRGDSDLRIGWEFNGDWMAWSAQDPAAFRAAFRHVAQLFKAVLPGAAIDWNGNWGRSQAGHDPFTELYPGDDVVDVVGLDAYDGGWVPARTPQEFATWAASDHSLDAWLAFARRHGKKLALPEWGGMSGGADGDNPAFIDGMFAFFRAHAADLAYEAYFNDTDSALYTDRGASSLPRAGAEYRALWGSLR